MSRIDSNSEQRTRKTTFGDALFDAVICESVTVFLDKQQAVSEYVRVAKLGGYVGLNEDTWVRASPPTELVAYIDRTMAKATFLTSDEWTELLEASGLTDIRSENLQLQRAKHVD